MSVTALVCLLALVVGDGRGSRSVKDSWSPGREPWRMIGFMFLVARPVLETRVMQRFKAEELSRGGAVGMVLFALFLSARGHRGPSGIHAVAADLLPGRLFLHDSVAAGSCRAEVGTPGLRRPPASVLCFYRHVRTRIGLAAAVGAVADLPD